MSSKTKCWTEEDFRKELRRLDKYVKQTQGIDLVGGELKIEFSEKARHTLGVYYSRQKKFKFSLAFFNSDVPEACAIDVIRHEYAHYYNHVVFGVPGGHGASFKAACRAVGANPSTYYTKSFEAFARRSEEIEAYQYKSLLSKGDEVLHPFFGMGVVTNVENKKTTATLTVDFGKHGVKIIDECWLKANGAV